MLHAFFNISSYIISGYESALSGIGVEVPAAVELVLGVISLGIVIVLLGRFGKNSRLT
jgi:formate-dependent nitrite reductase membrane component NrfD